MNVMVEQPDAVFTVILNFLCSISSPILGIEMNANLDDL